MDDFSPTTKTISAPPTIYLINGTWAWGLFRSILSHFHNPRAPRAHRPAIWSDTDSPFARKLACSLPKGTRILTFPWTGYNSARGRSEAAELLSSVLNNESQPMTSPVFLIAHSHGGNVALEACSKSGVKVAGIVTLATPFLSVSRRSLSEHERRVMERFRTLVLQLFYWLLIALLFYALYSSVTMAKIQFNSRWPIDKILLPFVAFGAVVCAEWLRKRWLPKLFQASFGHVDSGWSRFRRWRKAFIKTQTKPHAEVPILAVHATGDEASNLLLLGQFFNVIQRLLFRIISRTSEAVLMPDWTWARRHLLVAGLMVGGMVGSAFLVFIINPDGWGFFLAILFGAIAIGLIHSPVAEIGLVFVAIAVLPVVTLLRAGAGMFIGSEFVILSPSLEVHIESGPVDRMDSDAESRVFSAHFDEQSLLRHGIYYVPAVQELIVKWIIKKL
jgi:pimeloyl-ACP methyl ester carboxylesterase